MHEVSGETKQRRTMFWLVLLTCAGVASAGRAEAQASVPFVGCSSDGQMGPQSAPKGKSPNLQLSAGSVTQLAWYKAKYAPGVLAPRGWHCLGTYGSNGATLYVTPEPLNGSEILSGHWRGLDGPAVEVSSMNGSTSGRFAVARQVSRYFPQYADFATSVKAEGMEDASTFQTGNYPHDVVRHIGNDMVEFTTPAGQEGQGTASMLRPSAEPIEGLVRVSFKTNEDPYDLTLEVRLPGTQRALAKEIVKAMVVESGR